MKARFIQQNGVVMQLFIFQIDEKVTKTQAIFPRYKALNSLFSIFLVIANPSIYIFGYEAFTGAFDTYGFYTFTFYLHLHSFICSAKRYK